MENISDLTIKYIDSFLNNDAEGTSIYLNKINYLIYNAADTSGILKTYLQSIINNTVFTNSVLNKEISPTHFENKIEEFLSLYHENKNTFLNLSLFGPEFITLLLYHYTINELKKTKTIPKFKEKDADITLHNKKEKDAINIKLDKTSYYALDSHMGRILPVNGHPEINTFDYHLPIYQLIAKYFPDKPIHLSNTADFEKYIYVLTYNNLEKVILDKNITTYLPADLINDLNNNKAILILNSLHESVFIKYNSFNIFKQLKLLINENALKNIFILSGNMTEKEGAQQDSILGLTLLNTYKNLSPKLMHKNSANKIQIENFDYFEEAIAEQYKKYFSSYTYSYKYQIIKNNLADLKHFICLNRVVKNYRVTLSYLFHKNNLLEKCYISQDKLTTEQYKTLQQSQFKKITQEKEFDQFLSTLPYTVEADNFVVNSWNIIPENAVNNSFVFIVSETFFFGKNSYELDFFTEKTYKSILFFMPFIICGNYHSLNRLKAAGYKTFDKWWDESYDDIIDPQKRLYKIADIIKSVSEFSQEDCLRMYAEMKDVLEHNHQLFLNRNSGKDTITKIIDRYQSI